MIVVNRIENLGYDMPFIHLVAAYPLGTTIKEQSIFTRKRPDTDWLSRSIHRGAGNPDTVHRIAEGGLRGIGPNPPGEPPTRLGSALKSEKVFPDDRGAVDLPRRS